MAAIRRRTRQDQCRATRRIMTIVLLSLVLVATLRAGLMTLQGFTATTNIFNGRNQQEKNENVVILTLQVDEQAVDIRLQLFDKEAPLAARYVKELAQNASETCKKCTIYRGEPVPDYWGSPDYPDRYFDGGRWGPPYALVQGGLLSDHEHSMEVPPAESHNPIIERGMVAWAGGKGGPHFFIALAQHPEWGNGHTVWAHVMDDEDMGKVDALLQRPLVSTKPKRPPIVSNFVTAIRITIRMQ